uniref:RPW8 domain-containing protein n=2 Tax=Brassica oleracea TaxID=3712 RepID=A0A0D3AYV6_BRAOL|nr:unnamed protein product [Brassica oleracea]
MSDCLGGALVSEVLKGLIKEAKTVIDFKLLFEELASTMKIMIPLTEQIDTIQGNADFDFGDLKETIQRARKVKLTLSRKIKGINKDMFKFCQMDLQLLQYRYLENLNDKVDGLSKRVDSLIVPPPSSVSTALCSVPKPVKDFVRRSSLMMIPLLLLWFALLPGAGRPRSLLSFATTKTSKESSSSMSSIGISQEFPSFGPTYHLKPLLPKDAKNLLIQFSSPLPPYTNSNEFEDLLNKILKRCSGFRIVIEVVGCSLKGLDLFLWKGKVESWYEGEPIIDSSDVLECLQPSFNTLKPTLKECFMDMGSFLEDQKIRASIIIDLWVETIW